MVVIALLLSVLAVLGGALGWVRATKDVQKLPGLADRPVGVGRRQHEANLMRQYRLRRYLVASGGAVAAAGVGLAGLMALALTSRRK